MSWNRSWATLVGGECSHHCTIPSLLLINKHIEILHLKGLLLYFLSGFSVELTYEEWASRIDKAFEENFWIPEEPTFEDEENKLVHRRGIYKDSVGATHRFADYQLRPNLCVAMAVVWSGDGFDI